MNEDLLLLIKKRADVLIEQTMTKPPETLEFLLNKQMETFSFSPPCPWRSPNFLEDGIIDKLKNLLKFISQNDIELHVEEFKKSGINYKLEIRNLK